MLRTEETLAVDEESREKYLQTIVERGACGQQEVEHALPYLEVMVILHPSARNIERKDEQQHGNHEVVGHDGTDHHVAEGEEEEGECVGSPLAQLYDLTEDAIEEHHRVEGAKHLDDDGDVEGTVVSRQLHQSHIDEIRHIHVERQQWMSIHIVGGAPVAQHPIGERIESRYAEVANEILVIIIRYLSERGVVFGYNETVEDG